VISPPRTRHAPVRAESTSPLLPRGWCALLCSRLPRPGPRRRERRRSRRLIRGGGQAVHWWAQSPAEEGIGDLQSPVASVGEHAATRPGRLADGAAVPALIDEVNVYRAALSGGEIARQHRPAQGK